MGDFNVESKKNSPGWNRLKNNIKNNEEDNVKTISFSENLTKYTVGETVKHEGFGTGAIIQKFLKRHKIDACLISKNNQFLNEITSQSENFLLKVTNFTGSLVYALIYLKNQYLYVDGRYNQQAKIQSKKFIIKDIFELKKDLGKFSKNKKKLLIDPS